MFYRHNKFFHEKDNILQIRTFLPIYKKIVIFFSGHIVLFKENYSEKYMGRVVVTGIGLITPIGIGKEEFWKNNKDGKSGICDMPELEKFGFESKAYGYVKNFKPEQLGLNKKEYTDE